VKIAAVESFGNAYVALVQVRTDDGLEGWGQVAPYHADTTAEVLHRQVAPWQRAMYEPRPEVVDGRVGVPEGPGWGVEVSQEWLAHSKHRITALD